MSSEKHAAGDSASLNGELDDPARVETHLRGCQQCAAHYQELRALTVQVRRLRAPEARPEFVTRVLAQVREEAREAAGVPWWTWLWGQRFVPALAAACAVLVFGVGGYLALRGAPATAPVQVAVVPNPSAPVELEPGVVQDLVQAGLDVVTLAKDSSDADATVAATVEEDDTADTAPIIETEFLAMLDAGWSSGGDDVLSTLDELSASEQDALGALLQSSEYGGVSNEG